MRKFLNIGSAFIISMFSLLTISIPAAHAAGPTCTWNGSASVDFSDASNWSPSNGGCVGAGGVPGAGDNLVFDNSSTPTSGFNLTDDLGQGSGSGFASITFSGSGATSYVITASGGGTMYIEGDLTDTTTTGATINMPVEFQTNGTDDTVTTSSLITFGDPTNNASSININDLQSGVNSLIIAGSGQVNNYGVITTSGLATDNIENDSTGSGGFNQFVASPAFTGAVNVVSGELSYLSSATTLPDMFSGASGVTVDLNATLGFFDGSATNGTIAEPISVNGDGVSECSGVFTVNSGQSDCGAIFEDMASGSNLTFTGAVTLTGNSQFDGNDEISVSGPISGAFTMQDPDGELVLASSSNTSGTASGTYIDGVLQSSGGNGGSGGSGGSSSSSGGSSTTSAPKTPDTGLTADISQPLTVLVVTSLSAASLVVIARRLRPVRVTAQSSVRGSKKH